LLNWESNEVKVLKIAKKFTSLQIKAGLLIKPEKDEAEAEAIVSNVGLSCNVIITFISRIKYHTRT